MQETFRRGPEAARPSSAPGRGFAPVRPGPASGTSGRRGPAPTPAGPLPLLRVVVQVPHCRLIFGEQLVLVGAAEELGAWDVWRAPRMVWQEGDTWAADLALPAGQVRAAGAGAGALSLFVGPLCPRGRPVLRSTLRPRPACSTPRCLGCLLIHTIAAPPLPPPRPQHAFKLVVMRADGCCYWEEGPDRELEVPVGAAAVAAAARTGLRVTCHFGDAGATDIALASAADLDAAAPRALHEDLASFAVESSPAAASQRPGASGAAAQPALARAARLLEPRGERASAAELKLQLA